VEAAPATVAVVKPERRTIRRSIEQPGTVEPFEQAPLFVKVPGYVEKFNVDIGDRVKKGDVLAVLSVPELNEELKQKQALVAQAKAEVKLAEAALAAARAGVQTAEALVEEMKAGRARADALVSRWKSENERLQKSARGAVDQQQLDETRYQLRAAEAGRAEVEAKVKSAEAARDEMIARRDRAEADVQAAKAKQGVAEADERRVQALLGYTRIPAPFDGVVTARNVDVGHFLQPPAGKAEPLFVISRQDVMRLFVDVPEADAPFIGPETTARIRFEALKGRVRVGKVTRTSRALAPRVRTLHTEIDLPNEDGKLLPGMYFYATLTTEHADVWALPDSAVVTQGDGTFVYRVEGGKAVRTPVQVGLSGGGFVEVLRLGGKDVAGGEQVVKSAAGVTDGQAVK